MRGALIPHDAQVRRISWVVGSVDRQAYQNGSSCRDCRLIDPQIQAPSLSGAALFLCAFFRKGGGVAASKTGQQKRRGAEWLTRLKS